MEALGELREEDGARGHVEPHREGLRSEEKLDEVLLGWQEEEEIVSTRHSALGIQHSAFSGRWKWEGSSVHDWGSVHTWKRISMNT